MPTLDFDAIYVLAQHRGWGLETLPAYAIDAPPAYMVFHIDNGHACVFQSLDAVVTFLIKQEESK